MQEARVKSLAEMQQLEIELRLVQDQLAQYAESDPQKVEAMSEHASLRVLCMAENLLESTVTQDCCM